MNPTFNHLSNTQCKYKWFFTRNAAIKLCSIIQSSLELHVIFIIKEEVKLGGSRKHPIFHIHTPPPPPHGGFVLVYTLPTLQEFQFSSIVFFCHPLPLGIPTDPLSGVWIFLQWLHENQKYITCLVLDANCHKSINKLLLHTKLISLSLS